MRTVSLEVEGGSDRKSQMLGFDYVDFLSLRYEGSRWRIDSKLFTHL